MDRSDSDGGERRRRAWVAVREFTLEKPHCRVDYLLILNGQPAGVIEAKPEGKTLSEVADGVWRTGAR
jgi:type I site-specific restriction endonuclease